MSKIPTTKQLGFTIVELIIVIAVLAILASIVLVNHSSSRNKASAEQYASEALAIQNKAQVMYSEGISTTAYPTPVNNFPSTASTKQLPAGVGVTYTTASSSAIQNIVATASSDPSVSSSTTNALTLNTATNKRTYTVKSCGDGAGLIVFYPDPANNSASNTAVKRLTVGNTSGC